MVDIGSSARREVQEYRLNEGQAVRLLTLLKTEFAKEAMQMVRALMNCVM
jgi:hypothetical protein